MNWGCLLLVIVEALSIRDSALAGFDMILHATYMDDEALTAVVDRQVPIVPTFTFQANLAEYGGVIQASPELQELFRKEISDSAVMLKRAHDAGVPLLCGTESGFSLTPYGEWHYRELEVFVRELGFSTLEAIKAATSEAARGLRMYGETGAIKAGLLADVIVVRGDVSGDVTLLGDRENMNMILDGEPVSSPHHVLAATLPVGGYHTMATASCIRMSCRRLWNSPAIETANRHLSCRN